MLSITERKAQNISQIVHDRFLAKESRPTLGGCLEQYSTRSVTVFHGRRIIYVGTCQSALTDLTPTQLCQKIKKIIDLKSRYIYL